MKSGRSRRCKGQLCLIDAANGWPITHTAVPLTGAAMNAILHFPSNLAAELHQLKVDVEAHRRDIMTVATAFEQTRPLRVAHDDEIARRMNALSQRLAKLLA